MKAFKYGDTIKLYGETGRVIDMEKERDDDGRVSSVSHLLQRKDGTCTDWMCDYLGKAVRA